MSYEKCQHAGSWTVDPLVLWQQHHPLTSYTLSFHDILQFNQLFNAPLLCANCLQMQQQLCNHLWPANEKRFTCWLPRQALPLFPPKKKSQIDGAIEQIYIELCGCVCTSASDQCSNEPGQYSAGQRPSLLIVLEPDHGSTFCRPVLSDCIQLCSAYE